MHVLVVDDDADILELVADTLGFEGYEVSIALNGLEALRSLDARRPDVVLLDLRMPVMDGPTFARRCWERFGDEVPIIAMSAHLNSVRTEDLHVTHFLPKPFDLDRLVTLVAQAVT
jgi:CheY-like chemotaxis protein